MSRPIKYVDGVPSKLHPLYRTWASMKSRCNNPSDPGFKNYGARGITVHSDWNSFGCFVASMGPKKVNETLDRKDNNLGYSKDNCRWATYTEQNFNKRTNRMLTFDGLTLPLGKWAKIKSINSSTIRMRIDSLGWSVEKALHTPVA